MRAAKRQSQIAKLQDENEELRKAARQLMEGLSQYAKNENWHTEKEHAGDETTVQMIWIWKGEGDGPKTARYFLGLEENKN